MYPISPTELKAFIVDINTLHRSFGHINTAQVSKTLKEHGIDFAKTPMSVPALRRWKTQIEKFYCFERKPNEVGDLSAATDPVQFLLLHDLQVSTLKYM